MSSSSPSSTELVVPDSHHREDAVNFVRWAVAQLALDYQERNNVLKIILSEADQASFEGQAIVELALDDATANSSRESLDWNGKFVRWLIERLYANKPALHVHPSDQPGAINDISKRLFEAYQVEDGQIHLGGCQLTDMPFLRLSFAAKEDGENSLRHIFVAHDGSAVSDELAEKLALDRVEWIEKLPPRIERAKLDTLIAAGKHMAAKSATLRDPSANVVEPTLISLVWIKHASGQLNFTIGDSTATLPFSGWAKLIEAQPFVARESGASTFHLAATEDGRIDAYEQISICQHSGQRVLKQDLVTCSVTGKHVLPEFTEKCPVSGQPTLTDEFNTCNVCREPVSKAVIENNVCSACRGMAKIKNDDPRLVWILGEHAGLESWKNWRLAETEHVYIAQASSLLKRLLVVVDKETLAARHVAAGSRFSSGWLPLAEADFAEVL